MRRWLPFLLLLLFLAGCTAYKAYNFSGGFRFYDAVMHDRCLIETATVCGMDQ